MNFRRNKAIIKLNVIFQSFIPFSNEFLKGRRSVRFASPLLIKSYKHTKIKHLPLKICKQEFLL